MDHKAFKFNYDAFIQELAPILDEALRSDDVQPLVRFVEGNRERLTDPYEGEPLDAHWTDLAEMEDVHQLGDLALTAFYSPYHTIGLRYEWERPRQLLDSALGLGDQIVLGEPFGPSSNPFDPGKMGSFFQSESKVASNLEAVATLRRDLVEFTEVLAPVESMLQDAFQDQKGLYVTF